MSAATDTTFTASDGYRWHYRDYPANGEPRAAVVCLHGIQSHAGWYEGTCRRLADAGYHVAFLDRRGSGQNTEARGDAPSFRRLLDDVAEFLHHVRSASPQRPVVLLAISWGGKLAVGLQRRHPGLVDALALVAPGFCPKVQPPLGQRLAIAVARLVNPTRRFPIPLNDPELFTATPRWLEFLRGDSLSLHDATARLLVESFRLDGYARRSASRVTMPVLLQLAGRDRIIDNDRTRSYAGLFQGPTEIVEYPAAQHTLEFEPDVERIGNDLLAWLERLEAIPPPSRRAGRPALP